MALTQDCTNEFLGTVNLIIENIIQTLSQYTNTVKTVTDTKTENYLEA